MEKRLTVDEFLDELKTTCDDLLPRAKEVDCERYLEMVKENLISGEFSKILRLEESNLSDSIGRGILGTAKKLTRNPSPAGTKMLLFWINEASMYWFDASMKSEQNGDNP